MDGKMNCHLTAENAAFAKLRYLDNRVSQVEEKLDDVEQQVLENTNAFNEHVTQVSERVETKELSATSATANNATFTNAEVSNLNASDVTATTIGAETINVANLENVNVLHGKTVDVDKTIATIGQFAETHTTEANNTTTNTTELNVSTEANLTGQVNIDGNLTFTKDNGLSKLQGEYLEVDAANVVINNKNKEAYALNVPGIYGQALFGGSVTVQDTLAAKNLVVVGEALMTGLKLDESTELTNPTFKGIKGTNELTTSALVIDSEGKLVSKKISNEVEGAVASSLVCKKEIRTATLLDEWKQNADNSDIYKVPVSSTAQFVINETSEEVLLTNENGNQIKVSDLGVTIQSAEYSIVHKNFVYIIHPTMENGSTFKCVVIPINTNTMEVSPSFDITQYLVQLGSDDFSDGLFEFVMHRATYQPAVFGPVLSEDVPTIGFLGTNNYLDLSTMEVKTRDTMFGRNWYVLTKNDRWIEISGYVFESYNHCTNGKYSSVEDAALGVPACEDVLDPDTNKISSQLFYVDAPVFGMHNRNSLVYIDGGNIKNVAFSDIPGYSNYEANYFGTVDKDGNPVLFWSQFTIFSNSASSSNLHLMGGYYPRDYFDITTSYVETIVIDDTKVEVNGSTFVDGVWYDKVVNSTKDLIDFITKKKDNKRYKVLFTGYTVGFDTSDTSQFPKVFTSNDIYGTFDIYHLRDDSTFTLELNGTPGTATRISKLIDACHWHGFYTNVSLLFCNEVLNEIQAADDVSYLHINDCRLEFNTRNAVKNSKYYLGISDSNNVVYGIFDIPESLFSDAENKNVNVTLTNCYNVIFNDDNNSASKANYNYSKLLFSFSDRCEANIYSTASKVSEQYGPGYNFLYNAADAKFSTPTLKR